MRSLPIAVFVSVFLLCGWGVVVGNGQVPETVDETPIRVAMDLMDLDIPVEGSGNEMELPPIQGVERPLEESVPPEAPRQPAEGERSRSGVVETTRPTESAAPGLVPFLLEEPEARTGAARPGGVTTAEPAADDGREELPVELKTLPPPPSYTDSLRPYPDAGEGGSPQVPEIPLLKGQDGGERRPEPNLEDSSLTMKPLPDLPGPSEARSPAAGASQPSRRPEDTLQVREDIDAPLIDIFERYYKSR
jgi:hypothetical protein